MRWFLPPSIGVHRDKGSIGVHRDKGSIGVHRDKGSIGVHRDKGSIGVHKDKGSIGVHRDKGQMVGHAGLYHAATPGWLTASSLMHQRTYLICLTSSLTSCDKEKVILSTFFMATALPPLKVKCSHAGYRSAR